MIASGLIRAVQHTREVSRILALPRRVWTEESAAVVASELTALLRKPGGRMSLRPVQGQFLLEAGCLGGACGPIRVGGGKTLISGLSFYLLDARRPLLILPAKLVDKTKREFRILSAHWHIPNFIRIISYELLGRVQAQNVLDVYQPDVVFADEAHKFKNKKAACTKRMARYKAAHPLTKILAASGTFTKRSVKDYQHILNWCLPAPECPLPNSFTELQDWADALDEKTTTDNRIGLGALSLLRAPEDYTPRVEGEIVDTLTATRRGYRRRLVQCPGIVATTEGFTGSSLTIQALWGNKEVVPAPVIDEAFEILRTKWMLPDEWPLTDAMSVWRVARELSLGFYNKWFPLPPGGRQGPWMSARKEWSAWARDILSNNKRNLDSDKQVLDAVEAGHYPDALPSLQEWRRVKDSFEPNSQPVWLDDSMVRAAAHWSLEAPGIVWCEHVPFAEALAKHARLAYYGKRGRNAQGGLIEDHPPGESLIASIASNAEGRNLQAWHRNLITSPPPNGLKWEQLLGRTHRDDQEADEVIFDALITSIAHIDAFEQALKDSAYIEASMGQAQRLLYADRLIPGPDDVINRPGYRWKKK